MTPSRQKRPDYLEDETDPVFQKSPAAKLNKVDVKNVKALPQAFAEINQELQLRPKRGEDGRTPKKGEDYFTQKEIEVFLRTVTPKKGITYFTAEEIDSIIVEVRSLIPTPKDGKTPKKGIDYFTDSEIRSIVEEVFSMIEKPKNGKDAEVDYEYILKEVLSRIPKPKDGYTPKKGIDYFDGIHGVDGRDGRDVDYTEVEKIALKATQAQIEGIETHPPEQLGTVTVDESGKAEGRILKLHENKLIYTDLPKGKGKVGGGGASHLHALHDVTIDAPADNELLAYDTATSKWINQTAAEAGVLTAETDPVFSAWLAPKSSTVTYDGDTIDTIVVGSITYTMTYTAGVLTSMTDGTTVWTFGYDESGRLLSSTVS
jgi:YD repeat-containing protein